MRTTDAAAAEAPRYPVLDSAARTRAAASDTVLTPLLTLLYTEHMLEK